MGFKSHGSLRTELSVEGQAVIGSQHGTVQLSDRKNLKYEVRRYCEHRIVTPQSEKREKINYWGTFLTEGAPRRSLFFGGPKAEYFAGGAVRFQMGLFSLVPPQAAGRTEAVRSVRRAK